MVGNHVTYKVKDQSNTFKSGDLGVLANPYRQIKHLVIRMKHYSADATNDMRIHDITVLADLTRHAPAGEEPEESDGTIAGYGKSPTEEQKLQIEEMNDEVQIWWTGPWPLLHFRINPVSPDSPALRVEICIGLLPTDFRIVEASYTADNHEEWMQNVSFVDLIVAGIYNLILANLARKLHFWLWGYITGLACQAATTGVGVAIAASMIAVYFILFLELIIEDVGKVLDNYEDPWSRFYMILGLGLITLFGLTLFSLIFPLMFTTLRGKVGINDWFKERTDASMFFIGFKLTLALAVMLYALASSGLTVFNYI